MTTLTRAAAAGAAALLTLVTSGTGAFAQAKTMSVQEQANLKLVTDWWREVLQAGHTELAEKAGQPPASPVVPGVGPKPVKPRNTAEEQKNEAVATVEMKDILQYGHAELAQKVMAPGYIQHNPNVPTGRDGFLGFFKGRPAEPIKAEWKNEPELILTSGNIVLYVMRRFSPDPVDPSKVYKWNWFDMLRVDNGLIQEHWDMATKTPPPMQVARPAGFKEYRN
jgi:predicted SnoaL-like aldol condensation-catalyzing enzyme